jgi:hypothetical protein
MFDPYTLFTSLFFALAIWFLAHAAAALFTMTEPDIDEDDMSHRLGQAAGHAIPGVVFACIFLALL